MPADQLPARLLALELAFKSLAQLLHEQRVARLGDLAAAMEARAGLLGLMHGRASGEAAARCVCSIVPGLSAMLVGYMRVSSDNDRQATDLQRDALLATGVDPRHVFEDKASGARQDRPDLKAALEYVWSGDCLVVCKLDRLGRSLPHLIQIVVALRERGVVFRSLTEQMDTTTAHGELLFGLFGALAQYERALTRERVLAGLAAAKRRGRKGGRPRLIDQEKLEAMIRALAAGATKASVCRTFNVRRSTLNDTLARSGRGSAA